MIGAGPLRRFGGSSRARSVACRSLRSSLGRRWQWLWSAVPEVRPVLVGAGGVGQRAGRPSVSLFYHRRSKFAGGRPVSPGRLGGRCWELGAPFVLRGRHKASYGRWATSSTGAPTTWTRRRYSSPSARSRRIPGGGGPTPEPLLRFSTPLACHVAASASTRCGPYFASLLIRPGCSVKVVQARLGHASASETLDTSSRLRLRDDEDRPRAAVDAVFGAHVSQPCPTDVREAYNR